MERSRCSWRLLGSFSSFSSSPWMICCLRSEEHTSELQSRFDLVCRLLPPVAATSFPYTTLFRSRFQLFEGGDEIAAFLPAVYQVFIQQTAVGIFNCRLADGKVALQLALAGKLFIIFKLSLDDLLS